MPAKTRSTGTRTLLLAGGILLLVAAAVATSHLLLKEQAAAVASFPVKQGEFVISLHLKDGELEAVKSEQITSPRVRGQLKITHLFPEGEIVEVGDLVIEFDRVEFEKKVTEEEHELQAAKAEQGKTLANQGVEMARQEADIENKEASLRLAELQMEKMKFESFIDREEAKLKTRQAELALEQARKKIEAQRIVDEAERTKQELRVADEERGLERAQRDLESLTIHAGKPGLVVYQRVWKGGRNEKIRVGDEPWGGQTLITLPDLSRMQVKTWVNEVDVDKLEVGNEVLIRLDALPGPVFHGKISNIASLGHEKEGDKNVQVFDILVEIDEEDARLKPGMTAACEVIVETIPPRPARDDTEIEEAEETEVAGIPLYIPIDAVFEKGGRTLVYRIQAGQPVEQEVALGSRNENYVIVEEGLGGSDRVALRDPTAVLEKLGGVEEEQEAEPAAASLE